MKKFKKTIEKDVPAISRTPGQLEGSQYNFHDLLKKVLLTKVNQLHAHKPLIYNIYIALLYTTQLYTHKIYTTCTTTTGKK